MYCLTVYKNGVEIMRKVDVLRSVVLKYVYVRDGQLTVRIRGASLTSNVNVLLHKMRGGQSGQF